MSLEFFSSISGKVPYFRNGRKLITIDAPETNFKVKNYFEHNQDIEYVIVLCSTPFLPKITNLKVFVKYLNELDIPTFIIVSDEKLEKNISKCLENLKFFIILEEDFKKSESEKWFKTSILTDLNTYGFVFTINEKNNLFIGNTTKLYMFDTYITNQTNVYICSSLNNNWSNLNFFTLVPILTAYSLRGATINIIATSKEEKEIIENYVTATKLPFSVV